MSTILVAVDGSKASDAAVRGIVAWAARKPVETVHLVSVQPRLGGYIGRFIGPRARRCYSREQGLRELAGARGVLEAAGFAHATHIYVGDPVEVLADAAEHLDVDEIVVGIDAGNLLDGVLRRHMVGRLIRRARVPVVVVNATPPRPAPGVLAERLRPTFSG